MVAGSTIRVGRPRGLAGRGGVAAEGAAACSGSVLVGCMCKQSRGVALLRILVECASSPSVVENALHAPHASKYLVGPPL